ncbi:MAG TPA: hypothetical protein VFQ97_02625 [Gallionella sp.]|nr:hypothetical protein [Gallionella sp.]
MKGTSKNPDFIPTDGTTSHSTKLSKYDSQVVGYAVLRKKFLACILHICGAAKWGKQAIRLADARKFFSRLAFGRTLNF